MGCLDGPEPTAEEIAYKKRETRVVKAIQEVPLSHLTVADSLFLHGAFYHRHFGINESDVRRMEEILSRIGG